MLYVSRQQLTASGYQVLRTPGLHHLNCLQIDRLLTAIKVVGITWHLNFSNSSSSWLMILRMLNVLITKEIQFASSHTWVVPSLITFVIMVQVH